MTRNEGEPIQWRPIGRVRGRRRYYRQLPSKAEKIIVHPGGRYHYAHWHVDIEGMGNLSWRERRAHLSVLFALYRNILAQTTGWQEPYQCWVQIDAADSSQDAVFFHTPNSYGSFPHTFGSAQSGVPVPDRLREFLTEPTWRFGRTDAIGRTNIAWVLKKSIETGSWLPVVCLHRPCWFP